MPSSIFLPIFQAVSISINRLTYLSLTPYPTFCRSIYVIPINKLICTFGLSQQTTESHDIIKLHWCLSRRTNDEKFNWKAHVIGLLDICRHIYPAAAKHPIQRNTDCLKTAKINIYNRLNWKYESNFVSVVNYQKNSSCSLNELYGREEDDEVI